MEKRTVMVFCYKTKCFDCDQEINVYYTTPDFYDAPIIKRCKYCGEYYWYTPEDVSYIRPIKEQLNDLKCVKCGANLNDSLIETYKKLNCCGNEFSLDDDFAGNIIPDNNEMVPIDVYFIYS